MPGGSILAIDQGTTNTKALLVDSEGAVRVRASRPVECSYPRPAWVEQDALALWASVTEAVDECLAREAAPSLSAVAISNQRESVLLWERSTGRPVGPVVVWQCRRSAPFCDELRSRGLEPRLRQLTGLTVDALFSASKARWLLDNVEGARRRAERGELCLGTVDSWLLWNLTEGAVHACDLTNASRTQLADIERCRWDETLLEIFDIPPQVLPEIRPSSGELGTTRGRGRLPAGVPIAAAIGDSHAALFGHGVPRCGAIKATFGTGSSLMTATPTLVRCARGLSSTVAWSRPGEITYALEGNISVSGAAVQWVGELLGLAGADEVSTLAARSAGTEGVYLVPAFVGLGAPHWNETARGLLCGITRATDRAQVARAALEGIAYQVRDVFDLMVVEAGIDDPVLLADGGASRSDLLMQLQADILGRPVLRNLSADLSALGAAYLAGLAVGTWKSEAAIAALPRASQRIEPRLSEAAREAGYAGWRDAVARSIPSLRGGH
ncbi:MAG TPA: glycerol kinase GlpK [Longimicrobiales bacterium]|nr:glycerol kinase GlpK [Longimicrobiales bacterium]